jgi:hypothetical protein
MRPDAPDVLASDHEDHFFGHVRSLARNAFQTFHRNIMRMASATYAGYPA